MDKNSIIKSILKVVTFIVLSLVTIWVIGMFVMWTYPICSWATGIDIGIWGYYVTGAFFVVAAYFLWHSFSKKSWSLYSFIWIIAMASFVFCDIFCILEKYGENGRFVGDYIVSHESYDDTSHYGLDNKWGKSILYPDFDEIYGVMDSVSQEEYFVGVDNEIGGIELFDKNGEYLVTGHRDFEGQTIKDYIETKNGKIVKVYVNKSECIFP